MIVDSLSRTSGVDFQASQSPVVHKCSEYTALFEQSGPIGEKLDAAKTIVELMSNATADEIRSCPRPNGFTLFHFIPMANGVDEQTKSALYDRLIGDSEMRTLVDQPSESMGEDQLWFKVGDRKMPLSNGDRPSDIAVFAGTKEDVSRQLQAQIQQGCIDCLPNNTGNNLFHLAAGKHLDIMSIVCDSFRQHADFESYITHLTKHAVSPVHHACRSQDGDKLKVLARLLVEGAEASLDQLDDRDLTPLDHLKPEDQQFSQLMGLVEDDSILLQMDGADRHCRLEVLKPALSAAFEAFKEKEAIFMSLAQGAAGMHSWLT